MRKMLLAVLALSCLTPAQSCAEESTEGTENGRYAMYIVNINNKATPFLLDTRSGKTWYYSEGQSSNLGIGVGEKPKFKGVTVEGLVYSPADIGDLNKQVDAFHVAGFINKTMLSFAERLDAAYAYSVDLDKVKAIYERAKLEQPRKD